MSEPEKTLPQDVIDAIERGNKWTAQHGWIPKHGMDDTDNAVTTTEPETCDERTPTVAAENDKNGTLPLEAKEPEQSSS